ncbi:MAG: hypothetical protein KDH15_10175 [Rhodocyclaceae bacterium]|nr:hypothetical protein [Rhodocyclaceae bacterium]
MMMSMVRVAGFNWISSFRVADVPPRTSRVRSDERPVTGPQRLCNRRRGWAEPAADSPRRAGNKGGMNPRRDRQARLDLDLVCDRVVGKCFPVIAIAAAVGNGIGGPASSPRRSPSLHLA